MLQKEPPFDHILWNLNMRYKNPVDTYFGYFPLLQNYLTAGCMIFFSSAVNSYQWLDYLGHALSCHGCRASVGPTEWRPSPCEQGSLCAGSAGVCSVLQDLGAQICKGQTLSVVLHRASIWIQSDLLAVLISDPWYIRSMLITGGIIFLAVAWQWPGYREVYQLECTQR